MKESKSKKTRVLVVEDSNVLQALLVHILVSDPQIEVVGTARNGREALAILNQNVPDVILMDVEMPEMDGFETSRRVMETRPVPIVICSASSNVREASTAFRSMEAGAVACIDKPLGHSHDGFEAAAANLIQTVKLMSEVKVVRRWSRMRRDVTVTPRAPIPDRALDQVEFIGIGASTGGPPVLQTILTSLPKDFAVPIVVVQHIAVGFLPGLVEWLNQTTGVKAHLAAYGIRPMPGHVYLAPDEYHMTIGLDRRILLSKEDRECGLRPAVSCLFRSIAAVCGPNAIGVLLTGMGKDGAAELKLMRDRGAITIAQDRDTSVVHGMPGEALKLGGATYTLPADQIAPVLVSLVNHQLAVEEVKS